MGEAKRCTGCGASFNDPKVNHAPMLTDAAWARLAGPRENLCATCFRQRLGERGVRLTLASLKPCPFNLFHRPMSWLARAAARAGLALNPSFTIRRFRDGAASDNPTYLAKRERIIQGMRLAGVPEG